VNVKHHVIVERCKWYPLLIIAFGILRKLEA